MASKEIFIQGYNKKSEAEETVKAIRRNGREASVKPYKSPRGKTYYGVYATSWQSIFPRK